ncbi:SMC-Scp complex subunit ScpB [Roseofilum reptotaenium CS-1145]|uniref:SMC-Scp complex subunit ScpB n=1 Tax=Roseofilum reptotaenium AO1-A TaxID=1925591 RepID=A0A1L9QL21_9CYAN|nr:SMC-Scp complex subunit ScpB [Roseofilum reptotaenium]MDB9517181.1 SMC-Scp complex subunit ScpB [Roseofilum reptotaenium CS-1145]OJJ18416.1 SMC-Scp complex subunit ScpB [Roseofilum reptotaenium AO1-A]
MPRLATTIEAILYLKGQPVSLNDLSELAQCSKDDTEEALIELISDYAHRDSALEVLETPSGYSLQLRESFQELTHNLLPAELGVGALRTLAAIALSGSILQTELVDLRGSGAYQHVGELVELGLVRKRKKMGDRTFRLQVTPKFHQYFQLEDLPQPFSSLKESLVASQTLEEPETELPEPEPS